MSFQINDLEIISKVQNKKLPLISQNLRIQFGKKFIYI